MISLLPPACIPPLHHGRMMTSRSMLDPFRSNGQGISFLCLHFQFLSGIQHALTYHRTID